MSTLSEEQIEEYAKRTRHELKETIENALKAVLPGEVFELKEDVSSGSLSVEKTGLTLDPVSMVNADNREVPGWQVTAWRTVGDTYWEPSYLEEESKGCSDRIIVVAQILVNAIFRDRSRCYFENLWMYEDYRESQERDYSDLREGLGQESVETDYSDTE